MTILIESNNILDLKYIKQLLTPNDIDEIISRENAIVHCYLKKRRRKEDKVYEKVFYEKLIWAKLFPWFF